MRRMRIPKNAILNKMRMDGIQRADIEAFFGESSSPPRTTSKMPCLETYRQMRRANVPRDTIERKMTRDGYRQDYIKAFFETLMEDDSDGARKIPEEDSQESIEAIPIMKWKWGTTHRHKVNRLMDIPKDPKQILRALAGFTLKRKKPRKKKRRPKKTAPFQDCRPNHRIHSRLEEKHRTFIALMREDGHVISSAMLRGDTMFMGVREKVVTLQELKNIALTLKANDSFVPFPEESRYAFALVQQRRFTGRDWIMTPFIHHTIFSYLVKLRDPVDYMPADKIIRPSPLTLGGQKMMLRNIAQFPTAVEITAMPSLHAIGAMRGAPKTGVVAMFACKVGRFAVCVCKVTDDVAALRRVHPTPLTIDFRAFFEFVCRGGLKWIPRR